MCCNIMQCGCDGCRVGDASYYKVGGIETIEFIKAKLSDAEYKGFLKGNVIKYVSRAGYKVDEKEDYKKLKELLDDLKDVTNAKEIKEGSFGVDFV